MKKQPSQSMVLSSSFGRDWWFGPAMSRRRFLIAGGSLAAIATLPIPVLAAGGGGRLHVMPERRSLNGLLSTSLEMRLAPNKLDSSLNIFTRTYEGLLPGPTLRIKRGDTLRVRLVVDPNLPPYEGDPEEAGYVEDINIPHGFNLTNLHTHGLNVSPRYEIGEDGRIAKSSDNVLFEIPGDVSDDFFYEYLIPADHSDGTYWYHPHKHGSVAFQFMGGMAGALLIEGPTDEFFRNRNIKEQIFVLQQIRVNPDGVVQLQQFFDFDIMPYFTVNGQLIPVIQISVGDVQRWRFIHAGMAEHIPLELRGLSQEELLELETRDPELWQSLIYLDFNANGGEPVGFANDGPQTLQVLAHDGITLPALEPVEQIFMASGNRVDTLVQFDKPGIYFLIKPERDQGFLRGPVPKELLAVVFVDGLRKNRALPQDQLPSPYNSTLTPIRDDELDKTAIDPRTGQRLPLPHRLLTFGFDVAGFDPFNPNGPVKFPKFTMGGRYELDENGDVVPAYFDEDLTFFPPVGPRHLRPGPFNPNRVDQVIRHGAVEEWTVINLSNIDHPFHLHQVPIFVTEVFDPHAPEGSQITNPNKWQDVQNVPRAVVNPVTFEPITTGRMTFRVRFEGDIVSLNELGEPVGDFVLHCHMLDHEDLGMMQRIRVLPHS